MTTQIGDKFVIQGYHKNLLIILGLSQDFIEKNPLLHVLQSGARRLSKMAPILIIINSSIVTDSDVNKPLVSLYMDGTKAYA